MHQLDIKVLSFIIIYYFRATCFDSLEFIRGPDDDSKQSKHVALK